MWTSRLTPWRQMHTVCVKWWWNAVVVGPAVQISKWGRAGYNWFTKPLEVRLGHFTDAASVTEERADGCHPQDFDFPRSAIQVAHA